MKADLPPAIEAQVRAAGCTVPEAVLFKQVAAALRQQGKSLHRCPRNSQSAESLGRYYITTRGVLVVAGLQLDGLVQLAIELGLI